MTEIRRASGVLMTIVHQREYHLGRLLPLLERQGWLIRHVAAPEADFTRLQESRFDGVLVLGGDMGVYDSHKCPFISDEIEFLRAVHDAEVPVVGICLGGQLITRALGGAVRPGGGREVGWQIVRVSDASPLLGPAGTYRKFLWHRDAFELPLGAKPLAFSGKCLQAYRLRQTYALQFHPEVTRRQVLDLLGGKSGRLLEVTEAEAGETLRMMEEEVGAHERAASRLAEAFPVNSGVSRCRGGAADVDHEAGVRARATRMQWRAGVPTGHPSKTGCLRANGA